VKAVLQSSIILSAKGFWRTALKSPAKCAWWVCFALTRGKNPAKVPLVGMFEA